jgi:hypothetical protein
MTRRSPCLPITFALCLAALFTTASAQVNVTTWQNDNWRTGQNLSETTLTTSSFGNNGFGLICRVVLSQIGPSNKPSYQIYAQPLVVSNSGGGMTVYLATNGDVVYALTIPATWTGSCSSITTAYNDLLASSSPQEYPVDCCYIGGGGCITIAPTVGALGTPAVAQAA